MTGDFRLHSEGATGNLSTRRKRVTIAGKLSDDIDKGTLNSLLKQAKLKGADNG